MAACLRSGADVQDPVAVGHARAVGRALRVPHQGSAFLHALSRPWAGRSGAGRQHDLGVPRGAQTGWRSGAAVRAVHKPGTTASPHTLVAPTSALYRPHGQAAKGFLEVSSLPAAGRIIEARRSAYNTTRPHTSLNELTPATFATRPASEQMCSAP